MGMVELGPALELGAAVEVTVVAPRKVVTLKAKGSMPRPVILGTRTFRKLRVVMLLMEPVTSSGVAFPGHWKVKVQSTSVVVGTCPTCCKAQGPDKP